MTEILKCELTSGQLFKKVIAHFSKITGTFNLRFCKNEIWVYIIANSKNTDGRMSMLTIDGDRISYNWNEDYSEDIEFEVPNFMEFKKTLASVKKDNETICFTLVRTNDELMTYDLIVNVEDVRSAATYTKFQLTARGFKRPIYVPKRMKNSNFCGSSKGFVERITNLAKDINVAYFPQGLIVSLVNAGNRDSMARFGSITEEEEEAYLTKQCSNFTLFGILDQLTSLCKIYNSSIKIFVTEQQIIFRIYVSHFGVLSFFAAKQDNLIQEVPEE